MSSQPTDSALESIRFPVAGMTCGACVAHITSAVGKLPGVSRVRVDLRHEMATVRRDPARATDQAIASAIGAAGYTADLEQRVALEDGETPGFLARLLGRS